MREMQESPVFVKMFDLVAWVIPLAVKFPREQRFVVAAALQHVTLAAHEALIRAGRSAAPADALARLDDVATQLALLRFYLRLSERLSLITVKHYEYACDQLREIGRLVEAWRRSCRAKEAVELQKAVSGGGVR
ncbi:MAG: four helix bundle protein [Ktedonobacterales bacterium]